MRVSSTGLGSTTSGAKTAGPSSVGCGFCDVVLAVEGSGLQSLVRTTVAVGPGVVALGIPTVTVASQCLCRM